MGFPQEEELELGVDEIRTLSVEEIQQVVEELPEELPFQRPLRPIPEPCKYIDCMKRNNTRHTADRYGVQHEVELNFVEFHAAE